MTSDEMSRWAGIVGFAFILVLSGCAGLGVLPSNVPPPSDPLPARSEALAPGVSEATLPSAPPPIVAAPVVIAVEPASASATTSTAAPAALTASRSAPPAAKAPAKILASPAPAVTASTKESVLPDIAKPKAPPLDLASLERRLKDTKAIGVLTKITLKNQVDDLLDQFRAYYQGKLKSDLAVLRRSYDLLLLKVLSLLQDSDQALAAAIAASREAIWDVLSDPVKFAKI